MNKQVLIQLRADEGVKAEATKIFESLGLDLPTAIRMFLARSIYEHGLPFEVKMPKQTAISLEEGWVAFEELRKQAADVPEMTLDEINAEIAEVRAERRAKRLSVQTESGAMK